jgi:hypothetical protein
MLDQLKDYFRLPSAKELAAKELEMAQRKLLEALSAQEYAKRMGDYHSDRIKRLTAYLKEEARTSKNYSNSMSMSIRKRK